jgi:hypothetical protein
VKAYEGRVEDPVEAKYLNLAGREGVKGKGGTLFYIATVRIYDDGAIQHFSLILIS